MGFGQPRIAVQVNPAIPQPMSAFSVSFSAFQEACVVEASYTPKPNLFLSTFRFEHFTHSAARNSFAFHGIASEDDFGV